MAIEHLTIQDRGLKSAILAIGAANDAWPGQYYLAENTDEYFYGASDGSLIGPLLAANTQYISSITDTATVDLGVSSGALTASVKLSAVAGQHLTAQADGIHAKALTIHSGSTSYMEIDGNYQLKVKQLLITDNTVDATNSTLSAHLTAVGYNAGNLIYQESDVIILTTSHQTWIQNGGTAGTTADFTAISADVTDSYIRNLFSGASGVDYNPGTGVFSLNQTFTRALFSGTAPISYSAGVFSLATNGVANTHFRQSAALSVVGNSTGSTANVADIASSANDQFLVRRSGALTWGGLVTGDIPAASASKWTTTGSDIYRNSKVMIGAASAPMYMVDVVSDNVGGALRVSALNSSYRPGILLASNFNTSTGYAAALFQHTMSNGTTQIEAGLVGIYGNMVAHPGTPNVTYMFFGTETNIAYNNNTMRLYPNKTATFEGNTGFGTYTPSVRVHAVGDGIFSNALSVGGGTATTATGVISAQTGFRINNAATSGLYLRGNGSNFVASALLASDLSGAVTPVNGGTGLSALGTSLQQLRMNVGATAIEWFTPAATTYTFENGLTNSSGTVRFGGTLTQHTTLAIADFNHFVTRGTGKVTYFSGTAGPSAFNIYNQDLEIISVTPWTALNGIILYDDSGNRRRLTLKGSRLLVSDPL